MGLYRCISNMFLLKIFFNQFWIALTSIKMPPDITNHLLTSMGPVTPNRITFNIVVQHFIRIQLRAIRWKIKKFNLFRMRFQPRLNFFRTMNWMFIDNQKNFVFHLFNQPLQKYQKDDILKSFLKNHKT